MKYMIAFSKWAQANWLVLVVLLTIFWMVFLCSVAFSWLYGYWANALRGTHFEIASCWTGVGAIAAAFGAILSLAGAGWAKYHTDSKFNTVQGQKP